MVRLLVASNGSYLVIKRVNATDGLSTRFDFVLNKTHHFSLYINVSDTQK